VRKEHNMNASRRRILLTGAVGGPALLTQSVLGQKAKGGGSELAAPITGSFTNVAGIGTVAGTLIIDQFTAVNGALAAVGKIVVKVTDAVGTVLSTVTQAVTLPATIAQATCEVLRLELGPLDLALLGLEVHLNQVVLVITANPAGGLLGQLLCALAGGTVLQNIITLLNQILALFGSV
jgi:hypothetical protein